MTKLNRHKQKQLKLEIDKKSWFVHEPPPFGDELTAWVLRTPLSWGMNCATSATGTDQDPFKIRLSSGAKLKLKDGDVIGLHDFK